MTVGTWLEGSEDPRKGPGAMAEQTGGGLVEPHSLCPNSRGAFLSLTKLCGHKQVALSFCASVQVPWLQRGDIRTCINRAGCHDNAMSAHK